MNDLDKAWEAVNALGGIYDRSMPYEIGFCDAINRALEQIEKLGGRDPLTRLREEWPSVMDAAETPFAENH